MPVTDLRAYPKWVQPGFYLKRNHLGTRVVEFRHIVIEGSTAFYTMFDMKSGRRLGRFASGQMTPEYERLNAMEVLAHVASERGNA